MRKLNNKVIDNRVIVRNIRRLDDFVNIRTKIRWECLTCGWIWSAKPQSVVCIENGCPGCSGKRKLTNEIMDSYIIGKNFVRVGDVSGKDIQIEWKCLKCLHNWEASPGSIKNSNSGCPKCAELYCDNQMIDSRLKEMNRAVVRVSDYVKSSMKMEWKCLICEQNWLACSNSVISAKTGCPNCTPCGFSKKAITWMDNISKENNILIQHAENGGEIRLPNTKYKVDGFCKENNTVYEFYGDVYHGNLEIFAPEAKCHPYNKRVTAKELCDKTITRENNIKEIGYNVITIWEKEYDTKYK